MKRKLLFLIPACVLLSVAVLGPEMQKTGKISDITLNNIEALASDIETEGPVFGVEYTCHNYVSSNPEHDLGLGMQYAIYCGGCKHVLCYKKQDQDSCISSGI